MMAQCYAVLALASLVALSGSLQLRPNCSQLGEYALHDNMRMDLFNKVMAHAPKRTVSVSFTYECALEGLAGLILENPQRPMTCQRSLGYYPLIFQEFVEDETANVDLSSFDTTFQQVPHLGAYHTFGCNTRTNGGRRMFLCLFK